MDDKTYDALIASIRKWQNLADPETPLPVKRPDGDDCPLCDLFYSNNIRCKGCPVAEATGFSNCIRTPYFDASLAHLGGASAQFKHHAKRESDFLRALVPAEREGV